MRKAKKRILTALSILSIFSLASFQKNKPENMFAMEDQYTSNASARKGSDDTEMCISEEKDSMEEPGINIKDTGKWRNFERRMDQIAADTMPDKD